MRQRAFFLIVILLLVIAAYSRVLSVGFLSDDFIHLVFARFSPITPESFALHRVSWNPYYRPFVLLVWKILYILFGENATGYRLVKIGIHLINAFLIFELVRQFLPDPPHLAFGTGVFFALLPTAVEPVVWISGLYDLVATFFFLTTLLLLFAWFRNRRLWVYLLSLIAFQLCIWSKETAVIFPLIVLLVAWVTPQRIPLRKVVLSLLPYLFLIAMNLLHRFLVWHSFTGGKFEQPNLMTSAGRVIQALYFQLIPMQASIHGFQAHILVAGLVLSIVLFGILSRYSFRPVIFGAVWFIITFGLSTPLIDIGLLKAHSINSRYLYLPAVGTSIILAGLIIGISRRWFYKYQTLAFSIVSSFLTVFYFIALVLQGQAWLVADRFAQDFPQTIHELIPNPSPGAILKISPLPFFYRGAYIYWTGLDAALLLRYGDIYSLRDSGNFEEYDLEILEFEPAIYAIKFLQSADSHWVIQNAWGISKSTDTVKDTSWHWANRMGAGDAIQDALRQLKPGPRYDFNWDFIDCNHTQSWVFQDTLCDPEQGVMIPANDVQTLISPALDILRSKWLEVLVQVYTSGGERGEIAVSWQKSDGSWVNGSWKPESFPKIPIPSLPGSYTIHVFLPPNMKSSLNGLKVEIQAPGTDTYLQKVAVRLVQ